jgi:hypothetical protein
LIERGQCRDSDPVIGPVKSADAMQHHDSYFLDNRNPQYLDNQASRHPAFDSGSP